MTLPVTTKSPKSSSSILYSSHNSEVSASQVANANALLTTATHPLYYNPQFLLNNLNVQSINVQSQLLSQLLFAGGATLPFTIEAQNNATSVAAALQLLTGSGLLQSLFSPIWPSQSLNSNTDTNNTKYGNIINSAQQILSNAAAENPLLLSTAAVLNSPQLLQTLQQQQQNIPNTVISQDNNKESFTIKRNNRSKSILSENLHNDITQSENDDGDNSENEKVDDDEPTIASTLAALPNRNNQTIGAIVDGINLDEMKEFAKQFKLRRLALGLTQTQVGLALSAQRGPSYSQSAICRFEKLDITPKSATKIKPVLEQWMHDAEVKFGDRLKNGPTNLHELMTDLNAKKRKRRTSFTPQALEILNDAFEINTHPSGVEMTSLSLRLNHDREVIRVWFCNKRQALKNSTKKLKGKGKHLTSEEDDDKISNPSSTICSPSSSLMYKQPQPDSTNHSDDENDFLSNDDDQQQ